MNDYLAAIILVLGFIAFFIGRVAVKKKWKIADFF